MNKFSTVSVIALCAGISQGVFAFAALAEPTGVTSGQATQSEAVVQDKSSTAVVIDQSLVGQSVLSADSGEELGTIAAVDIKTTEPSEVTIALSVKSGMQAENLVVSEDSLARNVQGQLVATLSAEQKSGMTAKPTGDDDMATGAIDKAPATSTDEPLATDTGQPDAAMVPPESALDDNMTGNDLNDTIAKDSPIDNDAAYATKREAAEPYDSKTTAQEDASKAVEPADPGIETGSIDPLSDAVTPAPTLSEEAFVDRPLYDQQGQMLGMIRDVVTDDGTPHAVVGYGGFFGLFESQASVPLADVTEDSESRLVASISREQLKEMPAD